MLTRINEINRGIAIATGVADDKLPTHDMNSSASPLVNNKGLDARVNPSLEALLGKSKVVDQFPSVMGSEDFHEVFPLIGKVPFAFILVGVVPPPLFAKARTDGPMAPYSNHNPHFFGDLSAIPMNAKVDTVAALSVLAKQK